MNAIGLLGNCRRKIRLFMYIVVLGIIGQLRKDLMPRRRRRTWELCLIDKAARKVAAEKKDGGVDYDSIPLHPVTLSSGF